MTMKKLMNDKRAVVPRDLLINLVMFSMFVVGAFIIYGGMASDYGVPYSDNSSVYNKIADVSGNVNIMQSSISSSGASPVGFLEYISTGAWQSLKLIINSGGLISAMATQVGNDYNIPPVFILGFITIMSIVIIFGIISAIFRKRT